MSGGSPEKSVLISEHVHRPTYTVAEPTAIDIAFYCHNCTCRDCHTRSSQQGIQPAHSSAVSIQPTFRSAQTSELTWQHLRVASRRMCSSCRRGGGGSAPMGARLTPSPPGEIAAVSQGPLRPRKRVHPLALPSCDTAHAMTPPQLYMRPNAANRRVPTAVVTMNLRSTRKPTQYSAVGCRAAATAVNMFPAHATPPAKPPPLVLIRTFPVLPSPLPNHSATHSRLLGKPRRTSASVVRRKRCCAAVSAAQATFQSLAQSDPVGVWQRCDTECWQHMCCTGRSKGGGDAGQDGDCHVNGCARPGPS